MRLLIGLLIFFLLFGCNNRDKNISIQTTNWDERAINLDLNREYKTGSSYLSVYSEIYDLTEETTHLLTATVSMRNTNTIDSLFVTRADYYNTEGKLIRSYLTQPIFLGPLETVEIVIHRRDTSGGSGGNFIFDWAININTHEPLFEAVMIWTTGNQGISFATRGKNYINKIITPNNSELK